MEGVREDKTKIIVALCTFSMKEAEGIYGAAIESLPLPLQKEINKYQFRRDKISRIVSRLLIDYLAKKYLSYPADSVLVRWRRNSLGRPYLEGTHLDISISHSSSWVAGGISLKGRIGIDVETYKKIDINIFERYFNTTEMEKIKNSSTPSHEAIRQWSRKEAILKAHGRGLLVSEEVIKNIDLLLSPLSQPWRVKEMLFPEACLYIASEYDFSSFDLSYVGLSEILLFNH